VKLRKDVTMTIRLTQPLKDALERVAETERRSLSQLVGIALESYLEQQQHEWPPKPERARKNAAARRR
jgi:predicted transcriptional regulator